MTCFETRVTELGVRTWTCHHQEPLPAGIGGGRVALSGDWENIFFGAIFLEKKDIGFKDT